MSGPSNRIRNLSRRLYKVSGMLAGSLFNIYRPSVSGTTVSYSLIRSSKWFIEYGKQGQPDLDFLASPFHGSGDSRGLLKGDLFVPTSQENFSTALTYLSFFHGMTEVDFIGAERTGSLWFNATDPYLKGFRYDWVPMSRQIQQFIIPTEGQAQRSQRQFVCWGFPALRPADFPLRDLIFTEDDGRQKRRYIVMDVEYNSPLALFTVQET